METAILASIYNIFRYRILGEQMPLHNCMGTVLIDNDNFRLSREMLSLHFALNIDSWSPQCWSNSCRQWRIVSREYI